MLNWIPITWNNPAMHLLSSGMKQTKIVIAALVFSCLLSCMVALAQVEGVITLESSHDFATTGARLEQAIDASALTLVTILDHAANAEQAGFELLPTQLFIFGNPAVGTPLMQQARTHAIDLPQKMLVWQDDAGSVFISFNDPSFLATRHDLTPDERSNNIANVLTDLATRVTSEADL